MVKRRDNIRALLDRTRQQLQSLEDEYKASLEAKTVSGALKVDIKNILENLRSCLDYVAHDVYEALCPRETLPRRLYFPIRHSQKEFDQAVDRDFPGLRAGYPTAFALMAQYQPFNDPWLRDFNKLNNNNKHEDLVEQTRTQTKRVTVSRPGGGAVSWGEGVEFGGGVAVMGVPIDPRTQMPVPNSTTETTVTIWVDFRFAEPPRSVLPFLSESVQKTEQIAEAMEREIER